jgi:hypothetical protein
MKKIIKFPVLLVIAALSFTACEKSFNEVITNNPNQPTSVPPSLLFNGVENSLYIAPFGNEEKWSQYFLINYDYYGNNRYDFGSGTDYYTTLKNVVQMEAEAKNQGLPDVNPYTALGKFFRAYFFSLMSLEMGDLPMTEALQGVTNLTPAYDSQKAIFQQSFTWLEAANTDLAALIAKGDNSLTNDIYFGNDLSKWQKLVNTFRLRLLIHLSNRAADNPDLQVAQQFTGILGNSSKYPIMTSSADNLQYTYLFPTNLYPNNPGNFGFDALRNNCSDTYVGLLTKFNDPRVFVTSEPAATLVDSLGVPPTSYSVFLGANPGEDLGTMYIKATSGQYSLLNRHHYYDTYTAEPSIQIGYPELCFNIAEAINRGWVSGMTATDAESWYTKGIQESMSFYGIPQSGNLTVYFLHPGASLGTYDTYSVPVDFNTYYNQADVKYNGNTITGLKQILEQRYLALFRHSGLESYFTYRRTMADPDLKALGGVPVFETGPGTGNSDRIASRFQYPSNERTANVNNYNSALDNQFGGNDDINALMWIIK